MTESSTKPLYNRDGREVARAVAVEASVRCTDPVYGQMVTEVIFKDENRPTMLLGEYMVALEALAGTNKDQYLGSGNDWRWNQDNWEQGFFDELDMQGALDDQTVGPY